MNDQELMQKIDETAANFKGQIDDLYTAVGMIVIGRLFGWRVMRLAASGSTWSIATKLFGDPKLLMGEHEKYSHKSVGLKLVEGVGTYWEVIKRHKSMPMDERRIIE